MSYFTRAHSWITPMSHGVLLLILGVSCVAGQGEQQQSNQSPEDHYCYVCSSVYDGDVCHDPMDDAKLANLSRQRCSPTAHTDEFATCYKIVTTKGYVGTDDVTVITTRMCASWDEEETFYQDAATSTGSGAWRSYCRGNLCNSGHVTTASTAVIGWALFIMLSQLALKENY